MRKKLLECASVVTSSLGISGLVVTALGASGLILGLSGKVVVRLGEALKTHELTIDKMVTYGGNAGIIGLCSASCGAAVAWFVGDKLDCFGELEEASQKHHCSGCAYFSANPYLPCAVNPHLPQNCKDFTAH
ncbi:hypothetical protein [Aulosira sp. FACHB-615]|uniref:hypothetical protein n=1 Tax=Aulosira sp. FACHB-615 TaxID=2692777 RepID=UPI0016872BBB|nr:hypothetical protein [Aulosira sp. FACHB-615]MBD2489042.1 hypothetical protein [Aulosira sp. FACHB-615]